MLTQMTDEELIERFRGGEAGAFEVLFDRHRGTVYNLARVMVGEAELAEDVLQDAFLAIARAASRFEPRALFRTWMTRIVRNRCLNAVAARGVRQRGAVRPRLAMADVAVSRRPGPPEQVAEAERIAAVRRAIARLPERQREAIALYAFEGMAYREIADVMEVPVGTVKTLIHRARAGLARGLEETTDGV